MASRRKRLLLALIPLLLIAAPAAWIGFLFLQARATLDTRTRQCRSFLESFPPDASERPPIFDPAEPGDAWDLELQALGKITGKPVDPADRPIRERLARFGAWTLTSPSFRNRARNDDTSEAVLDLLRSSLRRRSATPARRPGLGIADSAGEAFDALRRTVTDLHFRGMDREAFERLILAIGLAQDIARHGDLLHRSNLWEMEAQAAFDAKEILESYRLSAGDLGTIATWLDRLSAARPPIYRTIAIENALEGACTTDASYAIAFDQRAPQAPTWRMLWSPLIRDARKVVILARIPTALQGIDALSPWEREAAAMKNLDAMDLGPCRPSEVPQPVLYRYEAQALDGMEMLRVAVALAWCESERGALPTALKDLVPRYLPAVRPSPLTGRPIRYEGGRLRRDLPEPEKPREEGEEELLKDTSIWRIGRRKN